tara:strand:- start:217 stop:1233 length:1017 start_codon:yes stop_codon:yes gene_type:complete
MNKEKLRKIANQMVFKGKGILAADESTPTCTKRFNSIGIESTSLSRNEYRNMLFTSPGLEKYISGIIMFDETIRQNTIDSNIPFPKYLDEKNILTGIKVDTGAKDLAGKKEEKITEGLDNLRDRLIEYKNLGASFTKWRSVITIKDELMPSKTCIYANANALARYASLCQENDLVPIVEPEVIMDGNHDINKCYEVTKNVLKIVFDQLSLFDVYLEGIVLKPNMVICGKDCEKSCSDDPKKVADLTLKCLTESVPNEVPGIAFLSGGQSSDLATLHLNLMNKLLMQSTEKKWNLTFSFGRALQQDSLNRWKEKKIETSQEKLLFRAKSNSLASQGLIN